MLLILLSKQYFHNLFFFLAVMNFLHYQNNVMENDK